MKLVDILARELKVWPDQYYQIYQDSGGYLIGTLSNGDLEDFDLDDLPFDPVTIAWDGNNAVIERDEWQAAVDALNQSELDAVLAKNEQLAAARAERIPVWNGEGLPPVGAICEYDARPVGMGDPLFVTVEVKYVSDQSIVIICTDVPDGENKENIGVELALMNGISMLGKFRAIRTAEQVAAEEREAEDNEVMSRYMSLSDCEKGMLGRSPERVIIELMRVMGYRKEPKPCGS